LARFFFDGSDSCGSFRAKVVGFIGILVIVFLAVYALADRMIGAKWFPMSATALRRSLVGANHDPMSTANVLDVRSPRGTGARARNHDY
jgi:hypothetical protein